MDFNLVSKNNLGAVTALLLVIILSQGQFFNFLLDTALGRAVLILFILFISYTNKILGVVSVLFIIIMFNNSNIGYMEGATTMGSSMDTNMGAMKTDTGKTAPASVTITATAPTTTGASPNPPTHTAMKKPTEGSEGHNLLETERTGFNKKSGSIPATKTTSAEGFQAFSGSFKEPYSQY
jgi:hypothetical protein